MKKIKTDICVIGAGSGGLSLAAGAVQMGARVVLVERDKMGGDCLNTGCVPSKAIIAAAHVAHNIRHADTFGIKSKEPEVDFEKVYEHVHQVIGAIAPNDSKERFEKLGVKVIKAEASFKSKKQVIAGDYCIKARRIVIATGSRAATPPIPGLDETAYLTNETIFDLKQQPEHLIIIGGGPIGSEMAQTHKRLGSKVTLLDLNTILPKDDPEMVAIVRQRFIDEGIDLREKISINSIEKPAAGITVHIEQNGKQEVINGSHLLVAAGRKPNLESLDLEKANVHFHARGVMTDNRLRSISNKKVYAIGDAAGSYQFTHVASYHAGIAIRNILFGLPVKVSYKALPWCTYVDPELAHVGLQEDEAQMRHGVIRTLRFEFKENDRAQAEKQTDGLIKVITNKKGVIVGCSIVGAHAGELILPWVLAVEQGLKIAAMANIIAPYPTLSEISKRVAGSYYTNALFSKRTRFVVKLLQRLLP